MVRNPEFATILILGQRPPLRLETATEDQPELLPEPGVEGMSYAKKLINTAIIVRTMMSTL
jgi:hypothetical protein